jgi:hypothetical protein
MVDLENQIHTHTVVVAVAQVLQAMIDTQQHQLDQ